MSETRSLFTDYCFTILSDNAALRGRASSLSPSRRSDYPTTGADATQRARTLRTITSKRRSSDRTSFARLHECPDHDTDEPTDDRAEDGDNKELAPDSTAEVTDRKEAQRYDHRLESGGKNGANRPRDNPNENIIQA
jgi:hypothetical protein